MVKKAFHIPVLLDLKDSEFKGNGSKNITVDPEENGIVQSSEKHQKKNVNEKSLTDEEYEAIFEAVLHSGTTKELCDIQNEDKENDEPCNSDHIQYEERNRLSPSPVQEATEFTPICSDEEGDKNISCLPPPPKKKKHFITKRNLHPKQLNYHHSKNTSESDTGNLKKRKTPARETTRDRLLALHHSRLEENTGTWVQCCNPECCKWRRLKDIKEPSCVPKEWFCSMNKDLERNSCDKPEEDYQQYEFVYTKFVPGSVVWAKVDGYPWWPAMVEDDPDTEEFVWTSGISEFPTFYHVVFFDDKVSRAWVRKCYIKAFTGNEIGMPNKGKDYAEMIEVAYKKASKALSMTLEERLKTYSFGCRYRGKWPKAWEGFDGKEIMLSKKKLEKKTKKSILKNYTDYGTLYTKDKFLIEAESILEELSDISSFSSLDLEFLEDESLEDSKCSLDKNKRKNKEEIKQSKKLEKKVVHKEQSKNIPCDSNCSEVVDTKSNFGIVGKGNANQNISVKESKDENSYKEVNHNSGLIGLKHGFKSKNKNILKQQSAAGQNLNQNIKVGVNNDSPKFENNSKQVQKKNKVMHSILPQATNSHSLKDNKKSSNLKSKLGVINHSDANIHKESDLKSNSTTGRCKKDKEKATPYKSLHKDTKRKKNFMPPITACKKDKESISCAKSNLNCISKEKSSTLLLNSSIGNSDVNKKKSDHKRSENSKKILSSENSSEFISHDEIHDVKKKDTLECNLESNNREIYSNMFDLNKTNLKDELESIGSKPFDMEDA